jgi:hypothetical protein
MTEFWFKIVSKFDGSDVSYVKESGILRECYDRVSRFNPNSRVYAIDRPPAAVLAEERKYQGARGSING